MQRSFIFSLLFGVFCSNSYAISNIEICEMRASIMQSIAYERDGGMSKKEVKRTFKSKLGKDLPVSFDAYVDAIYEKRNIKPEDIKTVILHSCYKEFGLIK